MPYEWWGFKQKVCDSVVMMCDENLVMMSTMNQEACEKNYNQTIKMAQISMKYQARHSEVNIWCGIDFKYTKMKILTIPPISLRTSGKWPMSKNYPK